MLSSKLTKKKRTHKTWQLCDDALHRLTRLVSVGVIVTRPSVVAGSAARLSGPVEIVVGRGYLDVAAEVLLKGAVQVVSCRVDTFGFSLNELLS